MALAYAYIKQFNYSGEADVDERAYLKFGLDRRLSPAWTIATGTLSIPVVGTAINPFLIQGIEGGVNLDSLAQILALQFTTASLAQAFLAGVNNLNVAAILAEMIADGEFDEPDPEAGFRIMAQSVSSDFAILSNATLTLTATAPVSSLIPNRIDIGNIGLTFDQTYWNLDFTLDAFWKLV